MLMELIAAVAAAPTPTPVKAIDPGSWFGPDNYPAEAMKSGIEGSVRFEVDVDAKGAPTSCRVIATSGSELLDKTTCDIVRAKGKFTPAIGPDLKPVAGRYSNVAIWRLPTMPNSAFHIAVMADFTDPEHPACTVTASLAGSSGPTCEQMLKQSETMKAKLEKLVFLVSFAPGEETPYRGEPGWGKRLSFLASEQYYLKGAASPVACVSVAAEDAAAGADACANFTGPRTVDAKTQKEARKVRTEISFFGIPREVRDSSNSCRTGESVAEAQNCN